MTKEFVYAIRNPATGHVKIGVARDPASRLRELQIGNSVPLDLLATHNNDCTGGHEMLVYAGAERGLHVALRSARLSGEWFLPTERLLEAVEAMKAGRLVKLLSDWHDADVLADDEEDRAFLAQKNEDAPDLAQALTDLAELRADRELDDRRLKVLTNFMWSIERMLAKYKKQHDEVRRLTS